MHIAHSTNWIYVYNHNLTIGPLTPTMGTIKKTDRTPEKEIEKAEQIRLKYFEFKNKNKDGSKK